MADGSFVSGLCLALIQNHHGGICQAGNRIYVGRSGASKGYRTIGGRKLHLREVSSSGVKKQVCASLMSKQSMHGTSARPSFLAASTRPWSAMMLLSPSIRTGLRKPNSRMLAAICPSVASSRPAPTSRSVVAIDRLQVSPRFFCASQAARCWLMMSMS